MFRHYLLGKKFTFHVEYSALLYLVSKQELTGKLARWTLLLQEFEFDILHRPGVQHAIADYLSRLDSGEDGTRVKDDFPDAQLFRVETVQSQDMNEDMEDSWITEIALCIFILPITTYKYVSITITSVVLVFLFLCLCFSSPFVFLSVYANTRI